MTLTRALGLGLEIMGITLPLNKQFHPDTEEASKGEERLRAPLTTLRVGVFEMGRQGLQMLTEAFDTPEAENRSVVITPELVVRESTAGRGG